MSFASDLALGFKSIFGNGDVMNFDINDINALPEELKKSLNSISEKAAFKQKEAERGIKVGSSERIITAPNIPVIGSIVAFFKRTKIDRQLKSKLKEKEGDNGSVQLEKDSVVHDAIQTNPYTNKGGKNVIHTVSASELENTPRELGGEERTKRGH